MLDESILLGEENFEERMRKEVAPYLFKYEEGGFFESFDGTRIHYYKYVQKQSLGHIVISHGFCEFAHKFEETIYYFVKQGFSVYVVDHRGHGYSDRKVTNDEMVYVNHFMEYVKDLHEFVTKIVPENNRYLFSHSMGGAIGILYLEKYPNDFDKAILSSPMCGMKTGKYPGWLAYTMANVMCAFGNKEKFAFGQKGFREPTFETSSTLSRPRYMYYYNKRVENTNYRTYGGSFAWVRASMKATKELMKNSHIKRITCPILIFQAGKDHLVDISLQDKFLEKAKTARMIKMQEAKHEIFNCLEGSRKRFYREVIAFYEQ